MIHTFGRIEPAVSPRSEAFTPSHNRAYRVSTLKGLSDDQIRQNLPFQTDDEHQINCLGKLQKFCGRHTPVEFQNEDSHVRTDSENPESVWSFVQRAIPQTR